MCSPWKSMRSVLRTSKGLVVESWHSGIFGFFLAWIRTNTGAKAFSSFAPSVEQPATICKFSHLGCHLQKTSQNIPFQLGLLPVDTGVPNGLFVVSCNLADHIGTDLIDFVNTVSGSCLYIVRGPLPVPCRCSIAILNASSQALFAS